MLLALGCVLDDCIGFGRLLCFGIVVLVLGGALCFEGFKG